MVEHARGEGKQGINTGGDVPFGISTFFEHRLQETTMRKMNTFVRLLRVDHYIKNGFIFLPLFFGLKITQVHLLLRTSAAFVIFSIVTSSIYIFNDLHDIDEDRRHPEKKNRPLASGAIAKRTAVYFMLVFCIAGIFASFALNVSFGMLTAFYIVLNVLYTLILKHIPIVDVFVIAAGFVIRILVGGFVAGVTLSGWIVLLTFLLAVFLGFSKRRNEVALYLKDGQITRKVVDGYNLDFLNSAITVSSVISIVCYIMYTMSYSVIEQSGTDNLFYTAFFVLFGVMRYLQVVFVDSDSACPTNIVWRDRFIQGSIIAWLGTLFVLLYV
jgi:decaprenyl-phosphate phosphoribosyltransferase